MARVQAALLLRILPGALLWAAAFVFVVDVVGLPAPVAVFVALAALGLQALVVWQLASRRG